MFGLLVSWATAGEKPWIEVDSPHFRVLSDGSDRDARRVAREFEQMRAVLADQFPSYRLESGAPLLIFAARDENSAKKLAPQLWKVKGAKPVGYFHHGWEKQFAMVRLDAIAPGAYQVVYHEYVHTVLHTNFRWLLWPTDKEYFRVCRGLVPATLQATALKVLLDEAGTEVNVELYQW